MITDTTTSPTGVGRHALCLLALLALAGCATGPNPPTAANDTTPEPTWTTTSNEDFDAIRLADSKAEKDRLAILAMRGDHRVDFHFQETVPLAPGYDRLEDKNTGGFEAVRVVESTPDHIVLQHLLVTPSGQVIKHWRQDWTFEAETRFEFVADQTWAVVSLPEDERQGTWTQCVFEVSDAPRYCGTGRWNHHYGVSTWTSDRSWRPLPRREYTRRSDYNAINAENRHTVTANGWTHEQDNTKVVRRGRDTEATLVREFGFNDYRRIEGFDFSPADDYWTRTSAFWSAVRDAWSARLAPDSELQINTEVDGMPLISGFFSEAATITPSIDLEVQDRIESLLTQWTTTGPAVEATANQQASATR